LKSLVPDKVWVVRFFRFCNVFLLITKAQNLELVKLEDITVRENFNGVFDGCKYVLHVAVYN
jgi:hypothetical protein